MRGLLLLLVFLALAISRGATLEPAAIRAAAEYSSAHEGRSVLVIERGQTRFEEYPNGGSARAAFKIYSGTKAFWNLAALAAAEDGLLRLDEQVSDTLPEWRGRRAQGQGDRSAVARFFLGLDPPSPCTRRTRRSRQHALNFRWWLQRWDRVCLRARHTPVFIASPSESCTERRDPGALSRAPRSPPSGLGPQRYLATALEIRCSRPAG